MLLCRSTSETRRCRVSKLISYKFRDAPSATFRCVRHKLVAEETATPGLHQSICVKEGGLREFKRLFRQQITPIYYFKSLLMTLSSHKREDAIGSQETEIFEVSNTAKELDSLLFRYKSCSCFRFIVHFSTL